MQPPVAAILADQMWQTIRRSLCGAAHPESGAPCVLRVGHDTRKHKTDTGRRWVTWVRGEGRR